MSTKINEPGLKINNLEFVKAVAKYFMDFLETDFHKRRTPKRAVKLHNQDNLLVGTNLAKYPVFNQRLWKIILKGFDKDAAIEKGAYMAKIPTNLLGLIKLQVGRIESKQLQKIIKAMSLAIEDAAVLHKTDYDQALAEALDGCTQELKEGLVLPFVGSLAKPLENQGLADENIIYLMEEELTDVLLNLLENKVSEVLKNLHAAEKVNVSNELKSVFGLTDVQDQMLVFFESLKVTDLFSDIYELRKNLRILDKQEFYLYFGDISYNRAKYPIFYIPLSLEQAGAGFNLTFDAQVYVNKKALEFIAQEHNQETGKKGRLSAAADRIFYLANGRDAFAEFMRDVFVDLTNFFGLSAQIDLTDPSPQSARSLYVNITNSTYITLFDKSDEALINDYEDILQLLESDEDSDVAKAFDQLINDFVHNEPASFNPEVEDEWDDLDTEDKLVFESPCPLNGEQLQILSAIRRNGCRYITVEGPPGTGKSHTITAVVFDAILKDQSVLVLSDKKEALDVVEDKITQSINNVRHDKDFQNPILRLGKTGNTYSQILATAALDNIKSHYRAVKQGYADLDEGINKTANSLKENLEAEIVGYSEIELKEVNELVLLESALGQTDDVIDVDEAVQQPQSVIELAEIRQICLRLKEFGSTEGTLRPLYRFSTLSPLYRPTCQPILRPVLITSRLLINYWAAKSSLLG